MTSHSTSPDSPGSRPSLRLLAGMITFVAVTSGAGIALLGHPSGAVANGTVDKALAPETVAAGNGVGEEAAQPLASPADNTAASPAAVPGASAALQAPPDPAVMVARLAARLEKEPDDAEGWDRLARAYTVLDQPADTVKAYRQVVRLKPDDSQALSDLGRAIGYANGRKLNEEAESLLNRAIQKDEGNVMAHALLGKTELERGQPLKARQHWEAALAHLDPKHPFADQLRNAIQMTEPQASPPGQPATTASPKVPAASTGTPSSPPPTTTASPQRP